MMLQSVLVWAMKAMWLGWTVYWAGAARRAKATRWQESPWVQLGEGVFMLTAIFLMGARGLLPAALLTRLWPESVAMAMVALGTGLTAAGLAFAIWARFHLGTNWSGKITLKDDHALIRSGPYGVVRHPIYSGVLLALFGTIVAVGELRGVFAFVLVLAVFLRRTRAEEAQMRGLFPEYAAYARATPALIPFVY